MKILTVEQMRQAERDSARIGLPASQLMENAGKAVADEVRRILGAVNRQCILVLVGPGNNGGDGLVAARHLHDWGARVELYLFGQRSPDDRSFEMVRERGITCVDAALDKNQNRLSSLLETATAVIDAVFGTGKSRSLADNFVAVFERVNETRKKRHALRIIALDLPSGLDADSGSVDAACLYADDTITLGFPKPGLFNFPGAERAGRITVADIGIPAYLAEEEAAELITADWVESVLPGRPLGANKGTFGKVLVMAGSLNYIGAAYLACDGAMRAGAGLVTLATATSLQPVLAAKLTEVTYLPLLESSPGIIAAEAAAMINQELKNYDVFFLGCGLGQSPSVRQLVKSVLFRQKPAPARLVIDADGLNTLAKTVRWWQRLPGDAILTPHPGEMARMTGLSIDEVQSDRASITVRLAQQWQKTVVLKGAYTVIASPEGQIRISPAANPGLASAGTGDVLGGVIAALLAQGLNPFDAAACGVYLHGAAGELVRNRLGDTGMIATDLLPALPLAIKQLKENRG
ncbi:MAG: NAD(P)H-hydrate dehydratase [Dehalococcoidales bacterium]|nr:NAD(P)H-hydrate dehydratase [Dehalococcoidales bacterium]